VTFIIFMGYETHILDLSYSRFINKIFKYYCHYLIVIIKIKVWLI